MVESSFREEMVPKEVGNELMIRAQRKIIEIDRERQKKMIDERAQKEYHYLLARPIYLSICISSSVIIPMSVGRELYTCETGNLSDSEQLLTATGSIRPKSRTFPADFLPFFID
jgi:hypothetical protein